ncbi:glutamyl-tRNA amidotransferase [Helicobacter monodelphidis]|uniref:GatB/YqeY domain-containing protein n=1 Tax=Helicobacter sp. 15-1451 TaxID=2004995 RepID=UPI000DCBF148|nr:GatB/YqeY domain-containing protein [Helicobacter sp. 15-1451]RAX58147.1 glutamyl-tRNA amidotransferase [Helicobacter sp. 15-1451]
MSVKTQVLNDIKEAMKNKDDFKRDTLRVLNAAFKQIEVDERIELSDERIYQIIASEIKKRKDAIGLYQQGNREDLAQKEQKEVDILAGYLPTQLSDEELVGILQEMIQTLGITDIKEQGKLMKEAKARMGASVDGKRLNEFVRKLLM